MTLTIETSEADTLAETLSRLTGETVAEAVTVALKERLERVEAARQFEQQPAGGTDPELAARVLALAARLRKNYDTRPVTQQEWDEACGEPF